METFDLYLLTMRSIYLSHCRRKGMQSDFVTKNFIPPSDGIFSTTLTKMVTKFNSIEGSLKQNHSIYVQADLRLFDSLIRSLGCILSDRSFSLRGLKKDEEKYAASVALLRDANNFSKHLQAFKESIQLNLRAKSQFSLQFRIIVSNIDNLLDKSIPSKILVVERFIEAIVINAIKKELIQRFKTSINEFSTLQTESSIFRKRSVTEDTTKSEKEIVSVLSRVGYDRLAEALNKAVGRTSEEFRLYHIPLYGRVVNCTLESLLSCILAAKLKIDEGGLYKLYRLILGVAELLAKSRSVTQYPSHLKFLENPLPWIQAQLLLDYLNSLVFDKLDSSGESIVIDSSQLDRREEWNQLVNHRKDPQLAGCFGHFSARKRHKGTVFVALQINGTLL